MIQHRRGVLRAVLALAAAPVGMPTLASPAAPLQFPRDHGAHLAAATEWWYLTGYANTAGGEAVLGYQVTFFRSRLAGTQDLRSALAARHLLFAHAAVTDIAGKTLWHDQRIARWSGQSQPAQSTDAGRASTTDMDVVLRDWSMRRSREGTVETLLAQVPATDFSFDLALTAMQPVLLQGEAGVSRKGPDAGQTSNYYSQPQLAARGTITLRGQRSVLEPTSRAWLDHEWSDAFLHPQAVGWDWIGINLFDGSALTAFRLRDAKAAALWDGGSFRSAAGMRYVFARGEVEFSPRRIWRSQRSGASYPVEWLVRTPADFYTVRALVDAQELDSRASTGAFYWEGLSEVFDGNGRPVGRGYLEMTGYATALRMS